MFVERITTSEQFAALGETWDCLARGVPFRSWAWLATWWRHYGSASQLYLLTVRDDHGQLVGLAPWRLDSTAAKGRVIRFLGDGEVCSDYLSILSTPEHEQPVVRALADWLSAAESGDVWPDRWDLLELTGIDAQNCAMRLLAEALERNGHPVHQRRGLNCWRIDLPETWKEYVATLSRSRRKSIYQADRRMIGSGRLSVRSANCLPELAQGMQILEMLHQDRWTALGQPGCFASRSFAEFLNEAAARLLEQDCLRLQWLEWDGAPMASEIQLLGQHSTYAYQSGIDSRFLAQSPGALMHTVTIRKSIEEGHRVYDLLRGDEPHKASWGARPRPSLELRVAARRPLSQLRHQAWLAGDAMKHWVKSSLNSWGIV